MKEKEIIKDLVNALHTMLVAVDDTPDLSETHKRAYINCVAVPRALKALQEVHKSKRLAHLIEHCRHRWEATSNQKTGL